jgi:hypothetical protein
MTSFVFAGQLIRMAPADPGRSITVNPRKATLIFDHDMGLTVAWLCLIR